MGPFQRISARPGLVLGLGVLLAVASTATAVVAPRTHFFQDANGYVRGLDHPNAAERVVTDPVDASSPNPDYRCRTTGITETSSFADVFASAETAGWYLGAVLTRDDSAHGGFRLVSGPARNPVTIGVTDLPLDAGTAPTATMEVPGASRYRQVHTELAERALRHMAATGTEAPAHLQLTRFSSVEDRELRGHLGLGYGVRLIAGLEGDIDWGRRDIVSRTVVELTQEYYATEVDPVAPLAEPFADDVDRAQVEDLVDTAPMYVSTVKYGRRAVLVYESTYSSSEVEQALRAYLRLPQGRADAEVSRKAEQVMTTAKVHGFVLGGSGDDAVTALRGPAGLEEFLRNGATFSASSPGAPISYELRHLDGSIAVADQPVTYRTRDCARITQRVDVELTGVSAEDVDDGFLLNFGVELYGTVSAEGIDGPKTVFEESADHYISVHSERPWRSGHNNHRTVVQVTPSQEGIITLRADLWENDDPNDDHFGPATVTVPYGDDWYRDQTLEARLDGTRVTLTFTLTPVQSEPA